MVSLPKGLMVGKIFLFLAVAMLIICCAGNNGDQSAEGNDKQYLIGLAISMSSDTQFFISLQAGVEESAAQFNVDILTMYANEDPVVQSEQIIQMADSGIDALLLNPVCDSVIPAVEEVSRRGIPVLTIDRNIHSSFAICHIASDNFAGGRMAGDYLVDALHRKGRIVEITGTEGSSAAFERGQGFREAISNYADIHIVSTICAEFSRDLAREEFRSLLEEDSDIDGVFAHNDDMILGAMEAARQVSSDGILFVGFDAIDEAINAVENGDLLATVAQRPTEMGRLGMETAIEYLSGKEIPDSIIVDLALILR